MPLISVIVPAYNAEKTIQATIESVLKQTFTDFELLVVDDGSSDSTVAIVANIADARVRLIAGEHAGASASRNRGFAQSNGELVAFLDADDLWTPDKLAAQLAALQNNADVAVAYSWTDFIDEKGQFLRKGSRSTYSGNVYDKTLVGSFLGNGSNALIRREAVAEVGGYDESLAAGQDRDLYIRLAVRYPFVCVPMVQNLYRVSTGSISSNVKQSQEARLQVIEKAFAIAPDSLQPLKRISLSNHYKYHICKALEGSPTKDQSWLATQYLWQAIRNDPAFFKTRVIWKVILKILVVLSLHPDRADRVLGRWKQLFNTATLLGYLKG